MIGPDLNDETESVDDLILGDFKVIQARQGYRFSVDAVLLAHFPTLKDTDRVIDLGTGNGVIPFLLAYRKPMLNIIGIELQKEMVERARRSIMINGLQSRVTVECLDIRVIPALLPAARAELVTCNPPFWKKGEGKLSQNRESAVARHEIGVELTDIIGAAAHLLKPGGRLAIIQRTARLGETKRAYRAKGFTVTRLRMVQSFPDQEARLFLIEGRMGSGIPATKEPPLIIYQKPGEYSAEVKAIYNPLR